MWDAVRYCSAACRRTRRRPVDIALERAVLALLAGRPRGASVCPSEAARRVDPEHWRRLMEPARAAARRLVQAGLCEITQRGRRVDPSTARGAIRVRLRDAGGEGRDRPAAPVAVDERRRGGIAGPHGRKPR